MKAAFVKTRMMSDPTKKTATAAWVIGIIAVAVRFIAVTQPFIDNWSWRESDVAAIARNFLENGFHFAHPQIDWAGSEAGYVGTEFPVLPFAIALIYKWVGVHDWIGRLQSILFFAASLPFFYFLVRRVIDERVALWALVFYSLAPLCIAASRAFMPDIPSLCLSIAGLYFFLRWLDENDRWSWLLASVALSFAILIKGTNAMIGLPLLFLSWRRFGLSLVRQWRLWICGTLALLPAAIWYWHAGQVAATCYPYHFFGAGGFKIMTPKWYLEIGWRVFTRELTPILLLFALGGVVIARRREVGGIFQVWLVAMILFVFLLGYGNRHPWYQLPLVPIAAVFAGIFCQQISERIPRTLVREIVAAATILVFAGVSFSCTRTFYTPASLDLYDLAARVRDLTPDHALIVAADGGDPTLFYYAHRRGWHFLEKNGIWQNLPLDSAEAISNLEDLRRRGANYLVFPFRSRWWLDYYHDLAAHLKKTAEPVAITPQFAIFKL